MPNRSTPRRTQFSSCDACRRSRVACDASRFGYEPGKTRWGGSCSRCSRRKRPCTFEWIRNVKTKSSNVPQGAMIEPDPVTENEDESQDHLVLIAESGPLSTATTHSERWREASIPKAGSDLSELLDPQVETADVMLKLWSNPIFTHGFETIFGFTIGRNGCPFVNDPTSEVCIPAMNLFSKLDTDVDVELSRQNQGDAVEMQMQRRQRDHQIDRSLTRAIQAFTARWLPLVSQRNPVVISQIEKNIRESWRAARKDMLKVINRASYRSVLTLYLFAQTPIPVGISKEEEMDGISGLLCMQNALLQVQRLRERRGCGQFHRSEMSVWADAIPSPISDSRLTTMHLDFESRAYWAAVMWDTSNSFASNFRTSLTSGLNGACSEPTWRLGRTFLVGSLLPKSQQWRTNGFEVTDQMASQILAATVVCKVYVWKTTTSLKEAFREGVEEETVLFVWETLIEAIDIFKTAIRPLLNNVERKLNFLDQKNRLYWYQVNLQYYLGILVMVNALEAADRSDLLSQVTEARQDAEYECFNVLKFGLGSTYTIPRPMEDSDSAFTLGYSNDILEEPVTASFIALDPYPNYVVDSVLLLSEVVGRKRRQGELKHEAYSYLSSTLLKVLRQLPQSPKAVQAAEQKLQRSLYDVDSAPATDGLLGDSVRRNQC